jgi:hypothetical protein
MQVACPPAVPCCDGLVQFGQYLPEAACGLYLSERVLGARALCRLLLLQLFHQLDTKISEEAAGGWAGTCSARKLSGSARVGMAQSAAADTWRLETCVALQ